MAEAITVSGMDAIFAKIDRRIAEIERRAEQAIQGAGIDTQADAKLHCPVGTPESTGIKGYHGGRLRASILYKRTGQYSCAVGTNVKYGPYVELGTYKMKARPFLFPGYLKGKRNLRTELEAIPGVKVVSWS